MSTGENHPTEPIELTAPAVADRLRAGDPITLLDVREPAERAFAAIPIPPSAGDLFIPMAEIPSRLPEIREALARGPVIVYCHHGVRSMMVAQWLAAQGLDGAINLAGGIDAWSVEVDAAVPRYR